MPKGIVKNTGDFDCEQLKGDKRRRPAIRCLQLVAYFYKRETGKETAKKGPPVV